jgi:hypothetical protein
MRDNHELEVIYRGTGEGSIFVSRDACYFDSVVEEGCE